MLLDISPLRKHRDYRLLYAGQTISFFGSMITYVAIPYQLYQITKSSLMVGLLGTVQLIPVLIFGLLGGSVADTVDRRKLLLVSEGVMCFGAITLALNSILESPNVVVIFVLAALMQSANGFHRPAMDAMVQKLVETKDLAAVSALGSFQHSLGSVAGPALGGILIVTIGAQGAYLVDFVTFLVAMFCVAKMTRVPPPKVAHAPGLSSILEGLRYAMKRPELVGTYVVDIVAMAFAFTTALYPAMGDRWGGATATGAMFSAMSVGALAMTLLSGWTRKVARRGAAVVWAAGFWGVAIIGFGYAPNLPVALACLAFAGAADMISGLFRGVIWNETVPNEMRGRMAGIEMISYMSGPLIGNTRAGWMAAWTTVEVSIISGGILCIAGVVFCAIALPQFWGYRADAHS